ncbi:hypothetical protein PIB30_049464 [Stylosanthes scabra]|uniref:Uncharacterized protein n=1 Tax=Stylosanthes scabra TaxID=79078 RepID=A0ABU6XFR1_9FABA|nr:hypothetical protein [Stylosanthes scabra]
MTGSLPEMDKRTRHYMHNRERTVVKPYPVTNIVGCGQQPTHELMTCTRIRHASYLFATFAFLWMWVLFVETDQNLDECPRVSPLEESSIARTLLRTLGSHPLVIPRAGYRHKKEIDERKMIGDFPGYLSLLILLLLLLSRGSRDSVADFMKTSPPTERILDISGFTISRLRSVPPGGTSRGARQPSSTRQMEKLSMSLVYDRVFPSPCSTFEG